MKASSRVSRVTLTHFGHRVHGSDTHVVVIVVERFLQNCGNLRRDMSVHRLDQTRPVLGRRKRILGDIFKNRRQVWESSSSFGRIFASASHGPFDLMVGLEKAEDRFDCPLALCGEHVHDHALLFDVLCDHFAGDGEPLRERKRRFGAFHIGQLLGCFDAGAIFAAGFGETFCESFDRSS